MGWKMSGYENFMKNMGEYKNENLEAKRKKRNPPTPL